MSVRVSIGASVGPVRVSVPLGGGGNKGGGGGWLWLAGALLIAPCMVPLFAVFGVLGGILVFAFGVPVLAFTWASISDARDRRRRRAARTDQMTVPE